MQSSLKSRLVTYGYALACAALQMCFRISTTTVAHIIYIYIQGRDNVVLLHFPLHYIKEANQEIKAIEQKRTNQYYIRTKNNKERTHQD